MKNHNYTAEILMAKQFIINHSNDMNFLAMLEECMDSKYTHSDRWSMVYDYCAEHYPEASGALITGLSYWTGQ